MNTADVYPRLKKGHYKPSLELLTAVSGYNKCIVKAFHEVL